MAVVTTVEAAISAEVVLDNDSSCTMPGLSAARVVVVGSSVARGDKVKKGKSWASLLGAALGRRGVLVSNVAKGGTSTRDWVGDRVKAAVSDAQSSVVVVSLSLNNEGVNRKAEGDRDDLDRAACAHFQEGILEMVVSLFILLVSREGIECSFSSVLSSFLPFFLSFFLPFFLSSFLSLALSRLLSAGIFMHPPTYLLPGFPFQQDIKTAGPQEASVVVLSPYPNGRFTPRQSQLSQACSGSLERAVRETNFCEYVDILSATSGEGGAPGWREGMAADANHPNAVGHAAILNALVTQSKAIGELFRLPQLEEAMWVGEAQINSSSMEKEAGEGEPLWLTAVEESIRRGRKVRGGNYVSLATVEIGGSEPLPRVRTVVCRGLTDISGLGIGVGGATGTESGATPAAAAAAAAASASAAAAAAAAAGAGVTGRDMALRFITDSRSAKASATQSRLVEVSWWFPKTSEQFRFSCVFVA